jgi:uracil-DNA glycosylase
MVRDTVPLPTQIAACRDRLIEEIYIVDPVLIVTLGGTAAEHVLDRKVTITKDRGRTVHTFIPGYTMRPVLTEKKGVWTRKVHGEVVRPTEVNEVRYVVLPTLHPAYVLRKIGDRGANSPLRQFGDDIRQAVKIYERYLVEALRLEPTSTSDADLSTVGEEMHDGEYTEAGS